MNYRKTHLYSEYEKGIFTPGHLLHPVHFEGVSIGLLICYDIEFPEPSRVLALQGASILICPTANPQTFTSQITTRNRAYENHVFVCYVNRVGKEGSYNFPGQSCLIAPNGDELLRCTSSLEPQLRMTTCIMTQEHENHIENNPYFEDRRPHLYELLHTNKTQHLSPPVRKLSHQKSTFW